MNIEQFRSHCLAKPGTTEGFPFDQKTLVYKVMGKMYALCDVDTFEFVNLKCEPEWSAELREKHASVLPGYHMNKVLWNSVYPNGDVPDKLFLELIDHSYEEVAKTLTRKLKEELLALGQGK